MKKQIKAGLLGLLAGALVLAAGGSRVYATEMAENISSADTSSEDTAVHGTGLILPVTVPADEELPGELGLVGQSLEEAYDARDDGIVPAIRNQGDTSLCWSYSALTCIEINLIKNGLADTDIDLSEQHLGFYSYYSAADPLGNSGSAKSTCASSAGYADAGGNQYMAALALMNWKGAVEDTGVFGSTLSTAYADDAESAYGYDIFHMGNWYEIPATSTDVLKTAIKEYGAVSINYYSGTRSSYYNFKTAAQYCSNSRLTADHAVTIIGWDDNFSRENFSTQPSGDGAWLVRNSWGENWGEDGYFWLSYEDATIYKWAYAFEGADVAEYDNNYQYDHSSYGSYVNAVSAANVFTAAGNGDKLETLEAVGIDLGGSGTSYSLQIYRNPTDSSGPTSGEPMLTTPQTGTTGYAGFYVIPLTETVTLVPGDTFAVVFELDRENGTPQVGVETKHSDSAINSNYDIEYGQSYLTQIYVSTTGWLWTDLAGQGCGNLKIKAYTNDTDQTAVACNSISVSASAATVDIGSTVQCTAAFTPDNDTISKSVLWSSSDTSVATVNGSGKVTAVSAGTVSITATTRTGARSASVTLTVVRPIKSVSFSYNQSYYYAGETYTAAVTVTPSDANPSTLTWTSSNEAVATVDSGGTLTILSAGDCTITATAPNGASYSQTLTANEKTPGYWRTSDGADYWYEYGVLQGYDAGNSAYRGKEIYDPLTDAWYWLDNVQGGAKAVNKDVYQESAAGLWADYVVTDAEGNIDPDASWGKWVRYDENGHMVKGWDYTSDGTYYFDLTYGTMAKGYATIDGVEYYFNTDTGLLEETLATVPSENGWKTIGGSDYWYEGGIRQGYSRDTAYRGKEIYDPGSDAWYWLDNIQGGAKAVSKDVYQESLAGDWGDIDNGDGTRSGKWVRYDAEGHMIKGWHTTDAGTYYFDEVYGTMAKGTAVIGGVSCYFDPDTGILQQ